MTMTSLLRAIDRPTRLSRREMEVLELVAEGHTSADAADRLCVSKRTVDFHLANVFAKLGVQNRLRAIREARRLGMIPFEPSPRDQSRVE